MPGSCGAPAVPQSRVIGGADATPGAWPWQVAIYVNGRFICGGSLITPEWVLTAAHCISVNVPPEMFTVVLGDHIRDVTEGSEQEIGVQWTVTYPNYDPVNIDGDLALVQLSRAALLNDRVKTVCLPPANRNVAPGSACYITGSVT